ncbi:MAG TPA: site-2 protease family protein [Deltaproteobacteria bacterium]|nr:site-2 protease family protein [Deltaproteobacteria bacterium]
MFGNRFEIFRLFGFPIRIDLSWLVILILVTSSLAGGYFPVNHPGMPVTAYWAMAFVAAIGLFFSILFHETAHALVGRHYRLPIEGITLFIFGGVSEMKEEAATPKVEFLMSAVGPLASGVLGFVFFYLQHWTEVYEVNRGLQLIFYYLGFMNLILALFNLVPAFPLDGGRMLRAALWAAKKDYLWATRIASRLGTGFGWLMIGYGVWVMANGGGFSGLWYILIGFFLKRASGLSMEVLLLKDKLQQTPLSVLMRRQFIQFHPQDRLAALGRLLSGRASFSHYPVIDSEHWVGYLDLRQLSNLSREVWERGSVADVLRKDCESVSIDVGHNAWEALETMRSGKLYNLFVTQEGQLQGVVTAKDLVSFAQEAKS